MNARLTRPKRWRRLVTMALIGVVAVFMAGCDAGTNRSAPDANDVGPEIPAVGSPSPAACPEKWTDDEQTPTRQGPFVPPGATEALLCSYALTSVGPSRLRTERRLTTDSSAVVDYLNSLSSTKPDGFACLMGAGT